MRVLLVDPHRTERTISLPNIGLAHLASSIRASGHKADVVEFSLPGNERQFREAKTLAEFRRLEEDFYKDIAQQSLAYDLIGVTSTYTAYYRAIELLNTVAEFNPSVKTALGGPHVSLMERFAPWKGQVFKDSPSLDIVVRGEGETTVAELLDNALNPIGVNGVSYQADGDIVSAGDRVPVRDLDSLPEPAWQCFNLGEYLKILPVLSARGCKFNCLFCDERHLSRPYRHRTPHLVVDELERNVHEFGVRAFWFSDSSLTSNPLLEEVMDGIIERRLKISWSAFARVDQVHERILSKMKAAGCTLLYFGVESGSQSMLDRMRKGFSKEQAVRGIQQTRDQGIMAEGSFIIGFPGETGETASETIDFASNLQCDLYCWHTFMPSFDMLSRCQEFGIELAKGLDWKELRADIPGHLMEEMTQQSESVLLDRHTAADLLSIAPQASVCNPAVFGGMSYREAAEWLSRAVEATGSAGDLDDFPLLLSIYDKQS